MGQVSATPVDVTQNPQAVKAGIKGLENDTGLNHCFLNVVIQSLWQVAAFRERLISLDYTHVHKNNPCVFCALRTIFTSFEFAESSIIPPDALRNALAELYKDQNRFQLKATADAEEVLEEILLVLHYDQVGLDYASRFKDLACSPPCISHSVFSAQICDILFCQKCGAQGDPAPRQGMLYRVYVADLLRCAGRNHESLSQLLLKEYRQQTFSCPRPKENNVAVCEGASKIYRWLLSPPLVFTMVLAWPPEPQRDTIEAVFACLDQTIHLHHFMQTSATHAFRLAGMICYYGAHYISFFNTTLLSKREGEWLRFDDKKVTKAGSWDQLVQRCVRGKFQPTIVFFESTLPQSKASVSLAKSMQPDHPPVVAVGNGQTSASISTTTVTPSAPPPVSLASLASLSLSGSQSPSSLPPPSDFSAAANFHTTASASPIEVQPSAPPHPSSVPMVLVPPPTLSSPATILFSSAKVPPPQSSFAVPQPSSLSSRSSSALPGYGEALDLVSAPSARQDYAMQNGGIFFL